MLLCIGILPGKKDQALRRISSIDNSVSIKLSFCNIVPFKKMKSDFQERERESERVTEKVQKTMKNKKCFNLIDVINRY